MSCGKKPLKKLWETPRDILTVTPSKYQQNDPSVKKHWRNVCKELEKAYKDEKFWETSADTVHEIVGPRLFKRIAKIVNIPDKTPVYQPQSEVSVVPSEKFVKPQSVVRMSTTEEAVKPLEAVRASFESTSKGSQSYSHSDDWSEESIISKSTEESSGSSETIARPRQRTESKLVSKAFVKSTYSMKSAKSAKSLRSKASYSSKSLLSRRGSRRRLSDEIPAHSLDDMEVHLGGLLPTVRRRRKVENPFYELLFCSENELDMVKWESNYYKKKEFQISASDQFNKRAEILTKKIAKDFFDWWYGLGAVEFKSEIRRPDDIEDLFQIWFDEHASRGLVLHPKILPCVLKHIANYVEAPKAACPEALDRQVEWDIWAEQTPAFKTAFGSSLPHDLVHLPPNNNTVQQWRSLVIPQDLKTMACVWEDIMHLSSTKSFKTFLKQRPHLAMPPCFSDTGVVLKKQPFIIPSDFVVREGSFDDSEHDLGLPVSEFAIELQDVLDNLMNQ